MEVSPAGCVAEARSALQQARSTLRPDLFVFILDLAAKLEERYQKLSSQLPDLEERICLLREVLTLGGPDSYRASSSFDMCYL
jgi:hypothetical protein